MTPLKVVAAKQALKIAKQYQPTFIQECETAYDFICNIETADQESWLFNPRPELYYGVRQDANHYYIVYAVYHRYDPAARHHSDLEGVLVKLAEFPGPGELTGWTSMDGVATVSHLDLKFYPPSKYNHRLWIEYGGHAITSNQRLAHAEPYMVYRYFNLVNMNDHAFQSQWDALKQKFNPWVHLPDQWMDISLETYVKARKPTINDVKLTTTAGLFWYRPDLLFALAEKRGRL